MDHENAGIVTAGLADGHAENWTGLFTKISGIENGIYFWTGNHRFLLKTKETLCRAKRQRVSFISLIKPAKVINVFRQEK